MKVFIDAGHGGKDSGAIGHGLREKDINLDVSLRLQNLLQNKGFVVDMTRTTDEYVHYQKIGRIANAKGSDIFVSIHCNAFNRKAKGFEVLHQTNSIEGKNLAEIVRKHIAEDKTLYSVDRGLVPRSNLAVLNSTSMPAILVELAFIDEINDNKLLQTKKQEFAQAIAEGICKYLGVNYKKECKVEKGKFLINGKQEELNRILVDGTNYVNIRDLERLNLISVAYDEKQKLAILDSVKNN